jgi:hypothetical protein
MAISGSDQENISSFFTDMLNLKRLEELFKEKLKEKQVSDSQIVVLVNQEDADKLLEHIRSEWSPAVQRDVYLRYRGSPTRWAKFFQDYYQSLEEWIPCRDPNYKPGSFPRPMDNYSEYAKQFVVFRAGYAWRSLFEAMASHQSTCAFCDGDSDSEQRPAKRQKR